MAVVRKRGRHRTSARTFAGKRGKRTSSLQRLSVLFWLVFLVIIFLLFVVYRGKIQQTLSDSRFFERVFNRGTAEQADKNGGDLIIEVPLPAAVTVPQVPETASGGQAAPAAQTPASQGTPQGQNAAGQAETPAMRERSLYLLRIDPSDNVQWSRVARQLPVSGSPMADVLNSLLAGPTREEQDSGLVSLIPQGTRILAASVEGNTARISFSEEFQYNAYGLEGCAASVRQIVWTVTEFPNVDDVQIFIEGRRQDHIGGSVPGEGVWIGSPISRSF